MKKEKFRRLPTFREYCNGGRIKENSTPNIKVEIEWWDDCIILILNELRSASESEPIIWEKLVDYCRARLLVLGREVPLYVDEICSEESKKIVEDHLSQCSICKEIYDSMCNLKQEDIHDYHESQRIKSLKQVKKKNTL